MKSQLKIALALTVMLSFSACQKQMPTGSTASPTADPVAVSTPPVSSTPSTSASPSASPTVASSVSPSMSPTPGSSASPSSSGGQAIKTDLVPLPGKTVTPITKKMTVTFQTTAGEIVMEVYPEAAPNAAARFVELVESGFFNDTPISRVVDGFVAQFGVNWREPHKAFKEKTFKDDPTLYSLDPGTLAFAKAGLDTNSTQVFINLANNDRLTTPDQNFTAFGKVVKGMEVVEKFARVGSPDMGLDQQRLWEDGGAYLESLDAKPTMIEKATVTK